MANDDGARGKKTYKHALRDAQIELVKLQRDVIANGRKLLIILEGRDAAGKDGTIKRFVAHMSPRETRVVALAKPSDREQSEWYFQRYVPHLPAGGEVVFFNRSWYNRAGVERVMGFCSESEYEEFMQTVPLMEQHLVHADIEILKYYLDISRAEQRRRLMDRRKNPLTQWKVSPIDAAAQKHWRDYSRARDAMLRRTHHEVAPWMVVHADDKKAARLTMIRDVLSRLDYKGKDRRVARPDGAIVAVYDPLHPKRNRLAR
ncbi:MAG: polyphosphate kinase 2 [Gemmatimonas sp.]